MDWDYFDIFFFFSCSRSHHYLTYDSEFWYDSFLGISYNHQSLDHKCLHFSSLVSEGLGIYLQVIYEYRSSLRTHEYFYLSFWVIFLLERCTSWSDDTASILEYYLTHTRRIQFLCPTHMRTILFPDPTCAAHHLDLYFWYRIWDSWYCEDSY